LLHHVDRARLRAAYWAISPKAAPGVDGVTWEAYGQNLGANLQDLHARLHTGRYRARPSRRAYIPKADGRQRPLGIASLEDKIVQRAVVEVLNAIYEVDFRGFSYGFRPGRGPHHALRTPPGDGRHGEWGSRKRSTSSASRTCAGIRRPGGTG
jgi:retron-type reverse transcriptase